jgi:hypothetical protein
VEEEIGLREGAAAGRRLGYRLEAYVLGEDERQRTSFALNRPFPSTYDLATKECCPNIARFPRLEIFHDPPHQHLVVIGQNQRLAIGSAKCDSSVKIECKRANVVTTRRCRRSRMNNWRPVLDDKSMMLSAARILVPLPYWLHTHHWIFHGIWRPTTAPQQR